MTIPPVRTALVAVDVQGTFADDFPGAGLPVEGSGATVDPIREFTIEAARRPGVVKVVTSQDWHPAHLPGHFAEPPDVPDFGRRLFPPHGVAGTPEAELHPRFATSELMAVVTDSVRKGQHSAAFSAFEAHDDTGRPLEQLLRDAGVERLVVYGWELANCVSATAVDGAAAGFDVWVVTGLCSVLDPGALEQTVHDLEGRGVHVIGTAHEALEMLEGSSALAQD